MFARGSIDGEAVPPDFGPRARLTDQGLGVAPALELEVASRIRSCELRRAFRERMRQPRRTVASNVTVVDFVGFAIGVYGTGLMTFHERDPRRMELFTVE